MQIPKRAFQYFVVLLTVGFMSPATFAAVCFSTPAEYEAVKSQLPPQFQKVPMIFVMGGMANAAVKVRISSGKFRITSGIWSPYGISYGDERVKKACLEGSVLNLQMANGSVFQAKSNGRDKVDVTAKEGSGTFKMGSESEYRQKMDYINEGAEKQGVTIPAGVR